MISRRRLMFGASATAALGPLTLSAAAQATENPMPEDLRQAIERQAFSPVLGNPNGDITLTEFFDYYCPICREMPAILQQLIDEDPNLRVVLREWPVLHPQSEAVARISLASLKQNKYEDLHHRLMASPDPGGEVGALRTAAEIGLDVAQLKRDMASQDVSDHIFQSLDLGDHMGLMGTPTFIAGHDGRFGRQSLGALQSLVKTARAALL